MLTVYPPFLYRLLVPSLLLFSIIFDKCSEHVAAYVDNCPVQVDTEHNLPGHEKVMAPVADTK